MTEQEQTHNSQFVMMSGDVNPHWRVIKRGTEGNWENEDQWNLLRISEGGFPRYHLTAKHECEFKGMDYEAYKKRQQEMWTKEAQEARLKEQIEEGATWVTISSEVFSQMQMVELASDYSKERNWEDQPEWDLYRTDYGIKRYRLTADQARKWLGE